MNETQTKCTTLGDLPQRTTLGDLLHIGRLHRLTVHGLGDDAMLALLSEGVLRELKRVDDDDGGAYFVGTGSVEVNDGTIVVALTLFGGHLS